MLQAWHCPHGKKTKMPRKNTPKVDISSITEKDDIHPRFILDSSFFCWNAAFIDTLERAQEAVTGDILQEKIFFRHFAKFTVKDLCQSFFFKKARLKACNFIRPTNLLKKKLWHRCFRVNFAKFLRTLFYGTPLDGCFWSSNYSLFFYGGLYRRFYICFAVKEKQEN